MKNNKNLSFERTLKSQDLLKKEFSLFKSLFSQELYNSNFILEILSKQDFNKITFAEYELMHDYLREKGYKQVVSGGLKYGN